MGVCVRVFLIVSAGRSKRELTRLPGGRYWLLYVSSLPKSVLLLKHLLDAMKTRPSEAKADDLEREYEVGYPPSEWKLHNSNLQSLHPSKTQLIDELADCD